ncbi:RNA polymerase sigma factor [Steroidobacter sp.]|uniref:RNA polymerase sigma factor n=1 Tax=Steroidobacter sp. TaxID=1978227 RepID=UPI001A55BE4D|nr:RNA polymerase sigma factor [Steroidobacter sp.]MBL8267348.1 RNA polymerase sigma factor [Steroidobacter sp.]
MLAPVNQALNEWFVREVLPHERALVRYLSRVWRTRSEVDDLLQEVYVRVYESAEKSRPVAVKSFLFTSARNLMTDRARRARVVAIEAVEDIEELSSCVDEVTPERRLSARQELKMLASAFDNLSPRCREVVWLRRVDELSQKEVAARLGVSARTVETYLIRGMQAVADALFTKPVLRVVKRHTRHAKTEPGHGKQ